MIPGKSAAALLACLVLVQADDLESLRKKYDQEKTRKPEERQATILAIGRLKTPEAATFLIGAFEKDSDKTVRRHALQALGACATTNAVAHLLGVAQRDSAEDQEKAWAVDAAVSTGVPETVTFASAILTGRRDSNWVREEAGRSLLRHVPVEKSEKAWRKVLGDDVADIRALSLQALAPLKDPQILALARTALLDRAHASQVRRAAVEVWRVKGGAPAVRLLLDVPIADDGALRAALTGALAKMEDDESFDALVAGIPKASAEIRAVAARSLGKSSHAKSVYALQSLFSDRSIEVRIAAMEAAAERGSDEVCDLLKAAAQKGEDESAEAAVGLLSGFPYPATVELLMRLFREAKRMAFRIAVLDSLARIGPADAFPVFELWIACLDEWRLRAASIRGLSKIRKLESVDLLIRRMGHESGRMLADIVAALKALTGKSLGHNPEHWAAWWKVNRDKFSFDDPAREEGASAHGTTTYHNIPILSRRMIFVLDVSGSMKEARGNSTRLGDAKSELTKVLRALSKETRVNLIFFSGKVDPWQSRLVAIGPNLAKAVAAVEALKAGGQTNIHDSLEKALEDPDVDTIYLLSDGGPSAGKYTATQDVLREVRRMNRTRQVAIHSISLGKSAFMKQLAADNGGQYQEIK